MKKERKLHTQEEITAIKKGIEKELTIFIKEFTANKVMCYLTKNPTFPKNEYAKWEKHFDKAKLLKDSMWYHLRYVNGNIMIKFFVSLLVNNENINYYTNDFVIEETTVRENSRVQMYKDTNSLTKDMVYHNIGDYLFERLLREIEQHIIKDFANNLYYDKEKHNKNPLGKISDCSIKEVEKYLEGTQYQRRYIQSNNAQGNRHEFTGKFAVEKNETESYHEIHVNGKLVDYTYVVQLRYYVDTAKEDNHIVEVFTNDYIIDVEFTEHQLQHYQKEIQQGLAMMANYSELGYDNG